MRDSPNPVVRRDAVGATAILLHPLLPLVGVLAATERGRQQNLAVSPMAIGAARRGRRRPTRRATATR